MSLLGDKVRDMSKRKWDKINAEDAMRRMESELRGLEDVLSPLEWGMLMSIWEHVCEAVEFLIGEDDE
jgi:hypothetical protein